MFRDFFRGLFQLLGLYRERKDEPIPIPPAPVPVMDPETLEVPPAPGTGSQIFVYKPVSESTGTAAIVLPSKVRPSHISGLWINGDNWESVVHSKSFGLLSTPDDHEFPNGDRMAIYLQKPGAAYGKNVRLVIKIKKAKHKVLIPDGGMRFEARV